MSPPRASILPRKGSIYYVNKGGASSKGKGKLKGKRAYPAIRPSIATSPAHSQVTTVNSRGQGTSSSPAATSPSVRCHFCNKIGHYKNNCRQFQALRNSPAYQSKLSQAPRHGLSSSMTILRMRSSLQGPAPPHLARIKSATDTTATHFHKRNFKKRKPISMNICSHLWKMPNLTDMLTVRLPSHVASTLLRTSTGGIINGMVKSIRVSIGTVMMRITKSTPWSNKTSTAWKT